MPRSSSVRSAWRRPSGPSTKVEAGRIDEEQRADVGAVLDVVREQRGEPHVDGAGLERRERRRDQRIRGDRLARQPRVGRTEEAAPGAHLQPGQLDAHPHVVGIPGLARRDQRLEADQVVAARVVDDAPEPVAQVVGVEDREASGLLGHVDQRLLRVHEVLGAIDAPVPDALLLDGRIGPPLLEARLRIVLGVEAARLQAAGIDRVHDDAGSVRAIHHPRERIPDPAGLRVTNPEIEAFRDEHDALASGEGLDAAQHVFERAQRARARQLRLHLVGVLLQRRDVRACRALAPRRGGVAGTDAGSFFLEQGRALLDRLEGADAGAAVQRVPHAIDSGVEQPPVGRELLQRADAAGGADDGDEIAGLDLRVDVTRQHRADGGGALERQAEVVDDDGEHARVGGRRHAPGRRDGAGGQRPRAWRGGCVTCRRQRHGRRSAGYADAHVQRLVDLGFRAALDDFEVGRLQVGDLTALIVDDDRVDRRQPGAGAERRPLVRTDRRRSLDVLGSRHDDRRRHHPSAHHPRQSAHGRDSFRGSLAGCTHCRQAASKG